MLTAVYSVGVCVGGDSGCGCGQGGCPSSAGAGGRAGHTCGAVSARGARGELDVHEVLVLGRGQRLQARQRGGDLAEEGLDVEACLGGGLDEHDVELARLGVALLDAHLPLVHQVRLVAHQHHDHVAAALRPHLLDPARGVEEGGAVADVVHDHRHAAVADVAGDEAAEALLPGGVPQLQPHGAVLQVHRLRQEVDADGGLVGVVELVVHEARDDAGLANRLVAQEDQLVLRQWRHAAGGGHSCVLLPRRSAALRVQEQKARVPRGVDGRPHRDLVAARPPCSGPPSTVSLSHRPGTVLVAWATNGV
mmetsp:Transcript_45222/g.114492  ORF Transcript_45222/g.114492 Transcript_45222/m.114492 type:complete len:307 (-) Transcript_45222:164-1084(-)